ncbi:MAG: PilZ domain-containing protein [Thermodesulfobacteriota bacterium]|nr:PilZ domain-containing protein [Thermodesulfobacteriota bacterium]
MFLKRLKRRRHKRFEVCWDALLEVRFPEFQNQMSVIVVNFSIAGALLNSEQIYVDGHHLFVTDKRPEMSLKMFSPEGILNAAIHVQWYRWLEEQNIFEVGIKFVDILKENQELVYKVIDNL